ncbi:jouberin-like [Phlebotomus papatasi]|uniref:jouberin-like n=1 Tax=Phlebotomus papatasi TaxID=29031 RepID=UPI0024838AA1|nr:jouberin-like [Phlebotomus papatasi]
MEEVLAEDKVLEKLSIRPRRRAFVGGSTSSNASGEAPVVQVEMADVHPRRPVPMPRKAVQETKIVQEIVDLTSVESDGSGRDIFFAESRKNTIIQPEVENPQAKLERIASESSAKPESSTNHESSISSARYSREDHSDLNEFSEEATSVSVETESFATKKHKKKSKSHSQNKYSELEENEGFNYEYIIGIYLHHIVKLKMQKSKSSQGPRIKVSWFDLDKEELLKKSDSNRNVSLHNEPDHLDFIQPLISRESRVQKGPKSKYISCEWEELLIFNEDINRVKSGREIVFFELVYVDKNGFEGICWAFLKPYLENNFSNIDKRSELQLYEYHKSRKEFLGIFDQFKKPKKKFPATIVVTLKGVKPLPSDHENSLRPMNVLQKEIVQEFKESAEQECVDAPINPVEEVQKSRKKLPGQQCKCPNQLAKQNRSGQKGSFLVRFHPDGNILSYSVVDVQKVDVVLASVPGLDIICCLVGHTASVYDMDFWTKIDKNQNKKDIYPIVLATASADRTVAIWNVKQDGYSSKTLPHPSFVYCCRFIHITEFKEVLITGSRDCVIRLWDFEGPEDCVYFDELTKHEGFVTCLCVRNTTGIFFSGDSEGVVIEWKWKNDTFEALRSLSINMIDREIIHSLILHKRGEKILVGSSGNTIYCVDMKSKVVLRAYRNSSLDECRSAFRFTLTPCGNLLFGSSDHEIVCWNTVTGDNVEIEFDLPELSSDTFISGLDFHPHDSVLVLGIYGSGGGIIMFDHTIKEESSKSAIKTRFRQLGSDLRRKIEVKNKLTEIIRKIDDVFLIPKNSSRLSDDDKLLEKKLSKNREEITEWLNNVATHSMKLPSSISHSSTYTIHKDSEESSDDNATFTVDAPPPKPPRSRIPVRSKAKPEKHNVDNEANLTYEIAPKSDPESDDTTISEELQ